MFLIVCVCLCMRACIRTCVCVYACLSECYCVSDPSGARARNRHTVHRPIYPDVLIVPNCPRLCTACLLMFAWHALESAQEEVGRISTLTEVASERTEGVTTGTCISRRTHHRKSHALRTKTCAHEAQVHKERCREELAFQRMHPHANPQTPGSDVTRSSAPTGSR